MSSVHWEDMDDPVQVSINFRGVQYGDIIQTDGWRCRWSSDALLAIHAAVFL